MESGPKLDMFKHFVWTTDKPYVNEPRISPAFALKNQLYALYLYNVRTTQQQQQVLFHNSHTDKPYYYLEMRGKSDKNVSILPCDVSVCILDGSEQYEYLKVYTKAVQPFVSTFQRNTKGVQHFEIRNTKGDRSGEIWNSGIDEVIKHISGFYERRFLRFKITFHCDPGSLHRLSGTGDKSVQTASYLNNIPCLERLSLDFSKLLDEQKHARPDVELRCGSYSVQAHRSILSARSDVFAAMLQCDMLEAQTGQVEVKDIDAAIFEEFITYLYSGTMPELTVDRASAFYEAGDKYAVRGLMRRCANFLTENTTPQNACDFLVIADARGDKAFKDKVMSYIIDKKIPLDEEHWPIFCANHPTLAIEVFSRGFKLYCPK